VAVNWSLSAPIGMLEPSGNIVMYLAPGSFPTPNTVTVKATLQSDSTKSATATVTIDYPSHNANLQAFPIKLGTSGGNANDLGTKVCCIGTLGSLIQRGTTKFILSNNHVLARSGQGVAGEAINQPGQLPCFPVENTVANLTEAAALKPASGTSGPAPSNVDAAIAQIVPGAVDTSGTILELGAASPASIADAPPSSTLAIPASVLATNEGVAKSGLGSGLTCSTLQSVSVMISVQYASVCGGTTAFTSTFNNQVIVNGGTFSAPGDSGSLIVTSDTARPVALLYGGNSTSTSGNPIQDIIIAFTNGSGTPAIVGGPDHAVSCAPTLSNSRAPNGPGTAALSAQQATRAAMARDRFAGQLMQDPAVAEVSVGPSADNPKEGAILVRVTGEIRVPIPAQLDGVRTRVIYDGVPAPRATAADINRAITIKEVHAEGMMAQPGVQGFGVGVSADNSAEPALIIYVIAGEPYPDFPAVIDGFRTQIMEGDRFRAFDWGNETRKPQSCPRGIPPK
jgi:hypothetical protein